MKKQLLKFATQDLNLAAKQGRLVVSQTKLGNIEIEYIACFFTFRNFNTGVFIGGRMTMNEAKEKLSDLYQVVGE
jgi:hypothetical protein